ncbi:MAG: hypothetical protein HBSAPP04_25660 [Ignavibacteriaceae bacterium]|nr:MAG: hypothetical protein EDM75_05150 [Chlorobiota bacterium]GJQ33727.1 MAG: hypothetical protein HBSAPP04_25660 [Ignavibacteriaceae bacterium]
MSGIRLGFRGVSNNGNNAFIDNIYIYEGGTTHSQTVTAYNTQWQYFGTTGIGIRFSTGNSLDVNLTVDKINSNPGGTLPPGDLTNLGKIYWSVTVNSGTADGTYSFSVDYRNYPGVNNKNTVHLLKRDNETAEWVDLGTPDFVGTGSSTEWMWYGLTGFSEFAIAGGDDNPLPVELANFTAKAKNRTVTLKWETKTEVDNSGFEVQRLDGEGDWKKISFIEGHGTTNSTKYYSFEDTKLPAGKHSYRLKQIDNDGTTSYSDVVEVTIDLPKEFALSQNYPNPFNPSTKVDYQLAADSKVTIELYGITGERVAGLVNQEQEAGYYTMMIDSYTHMMASGIYIYRMIATGPTGKSFVMTKKLTLMK